MSSLDTMIAKLETNLGKNHSDSPFDRLRLKYGAAKIESYVKDIPDKKEEVQKKVDQE